MLSHVRLRHTIISTPCPVLFPLWALRRGNSHTEGAKGFIQFSSLDKTWKIGCLGLITPFQFQSFSLVTHVCHLENISQLACILDTVLNSQGFEFDGGTPVWFTLQQFQSRNYTASCSVIMAMLFHGCYWWFSINFILLQPQLISLLHSAGKNNYSAFFTGNSVALMCK